MDLYIHSHIWLHDVVLNETEGQLFFTFAFASAYLEPKNETNAMWRR